MYKIYVTLQESMILRERCLHKYFHEVGSCEDSIMPTELTYTIIMLGSRIFKKGLLLLLLIFIFLHNVNLIEESAFDNHVIEEGVSLENLKQKFWR